MTSSKLEESQEDAAQARAELSERTVQLSVLTDTIEALQVGTVSEQEQRIVDLTAQLVASRMKEVNLERRVGILSAAQQQAKAEASKARAESTSALADLKVTAAAESVKRQQSEQLAAELSELRSELRRLESARQSLEEDNQRTARARATAESEVAGLQEAMQRATARHFDQLSKERSMASSQRQQTSGLVCQETEASEPGYLTRLRTQLDSMAADLRHASACGGASRSTIFWPSPGQ